MVSYGQYCPISRAAEVLGERWTVVILRNILLGATTFNAIADGAPGLSRTLLSKRLRELARAGVIDILPNPSGRGSVYVPTAAGRDAWATMESLGIWAARWLELQPTHANPDVVLWSWVNNCLAVERLPERRVVVEFRFHDQPERRRRYWVLFGPDRAEVCLKPPGYDIDLVVEAQALSFARWHAGAIEWGQAIRSGGITVTGPTRLARALPTWNRRSHFAPHVTAESAR
ncbi:MAG: helix-turn-helix transcriptional regulator [Actinobacteria bacterium]|nr:helix-turn-helix transcriptional regulator [Actinomycetota bacterium]